MKFNSETNLVFQFIKQQKLKTIGIIILGLISNLLSIIIPVSIGKYYELAFHFNSHRVKILNFIPSTIWDSIPKFLLFFISLVLLRYLFFFLYEFLLKKESEIFVKEIKDYLFNHQLRIKYDIYTEKGVGKYLLRYSGDINSLKNLYLKGSIKVFIDIIMMMIAFSWLYTLNYKGAIAIAIISLIAYLIIRILNNKVEYYSQKKRNKTSGQLSYISRTLNSILNIILFNKQDIEFKKYSKKSSSIKDVAICYDKWFVINKGFISFTQYSILCVALYIFYLDSSKSPGLTQGGNLISFILLYITILPIIRRLFALETVYKLGYISLNKLNNIINIPKEEITIGEVLTVKKPRILFEELKFNNTLGLNFHSKKMTLSSLSLPNGIEPYDIITALTKINSDYKGTIKINNIDIKYYSPKSLRDNIAALSDNIPLTGRTVYEAITMFRAEKIKDNITLLFSEIQSLFSNIPKLSIDDNIGENGSKLSIIQYELLCFIRGIVSNKKILIIDGLYLLQSNNYKGMIELLENQNATVILLKSLNKI